MINNDKTNPIFTIIIIFISIIWFLELLLFKRESICVRVFSQPHHSFSLHPERHQKILTNFSKAFPRMVSKSNFH